LCRGLIRQCQYASPESFLQEGLRLLTEKEESAGSRFVAILLVNMPAVFRTLTDRWEFTLEEAISVALRLLHISPNFDTRMSKLLPGRGNVPGQVTLEGEFAERALEILDAISPSSRITQSVRHLTEHPNSKISSKAALLVGKRSQDLVWAKGVLAKATDSRLRANALEAFWGMDSPSVVELFREYLQDKDNRVVGNAIIGLYKAGDPEAPQLVSRIASEPDPKLRMTAAWTMGRIGDPSFVPILAPLAKDTHADVRRAALRSLRGFHTAMAANANG
jgi:hypothetical protein